MSAAVLGALVGGGCGLVLAPYLARLTRTVPDAEARRWWRGARPTPAVTAATAGTAVALGALAGAAAHWSALLPAFVALALFAAPLVVIDVQVHRLPDRLVLPLAGAAAVLLTGAAAQRSAWTELLRAAEGAAALYAALFAICFVAPGSFGFGDVKLGGVLGAYLGWFGWLHVFYGVFAGFVLGAALAVGLLATGRATRKTPIPFGPMLVLGALLVLALDLVPSTG